MFGSLTKEQRQYSGAKAVYSKSGAGTTGNLHAKKMHLHINITPFTNTNWEWIIDQNLWCKTIKLEYGGACLDITPKTWSMK